VIVASEPAGASQDGVAAAVRATPGIAAVTPVRTSSDGMAAMFNAYPRTAMQDPATTDLVHTLREWVIPTAVAGSGAVVHVGGPTAATVDFTDAVAKRLP
jgi:RND superfamily putative drug exporter